MTPRAPDLMSALFDEVRAIVRAELAAQRSVDVDWYDQTSSPLGKKRHLYLARAGKIPACKVGKMVLIRRADVDEYIRKHPVRPRDERVATDQAESAQADQILAAYGYDLRGR